MKDLFRKANLFYDSKVLLWAIISFGIIARLGQYLFNRSLWLDESMLALNVLNRSFSGLMQILDYKQIAPVGFLMVEKVLVQMLGSSEYALRLFPLLCGIISLFLFYKVATHYIDKRAVPIALGLFAISDRLIYYSSEAKQYSSDVFIALLLYVIVIYIQSKRLSPLRIVFFGVIGAIAIWISHPAVFILAGIGVSLTSFSLYKKEWLRIYRLLIVYSIWLVSFAISYFGGLAKFLSSDFSRDFIMSYSDRKLFMPFPPATISDLRWFLDTFFGIFKDPVWPFVPGIAVLVFFFGCFAMFMRKRKGFFVLMSFVPFIMLASGLHRYPLHPRLLLFIAPFILLFIAQGASYLIFNASRKSAIIGMILVALLFFRPIVSVNYRLIKPRIQEEVKPVISHIRQNWQNGDVLYVYYGALPAFKYYSEDYGFKKGDYVKGMSSRGDQSKYKKDLYKLRGNTRAWVLFSHKRTDEEALFLSSLDKIGSRISLFRAPGAVVYLYDLS